MAKDYPALNPHHRAFIARQHIFFTASAAAGSRVNLSPRATDLFRIMDDNRVLYLDRTGSGNETAAHIRAGGAMTIMFCAVAGPPLILRLYGKGRVLRRGGAEYLAVLRERFDGREPLGARQMVQLEFDLVKTSCGFGVPLFDYQDERDTLDRWAEAKGEEGIAAYWEEKNLLSMDGLPTGMDRD